MTVNLNSDTHVSLLSYNPLRESPLLQEFIQAHTRRETKLRYENRSWYLCIYSMNNQAHILYSTVYVLYLDQ